MPETKQSPEPSQDEQWDLVIRGGTVIDGTGGASQQVDVAIRDGRIARVGNVSGKGASEIDATGLVVAPGFVDVHTHYDGQATWDERLAPSSWHGVTTVVTGNCGVGFAPCRAEDHDMLVRLMEGVEDIPGVVLTEGLAWNWESFPEFLDAIEAKPHDIDLAVQLPHGPLRVYVMGERGANLEAATPDEIAQMAELTREALLAGAIGFSSSRTLNHRTSDGKPTPSLTAAEDELLGIAGALADTDRGVMQFVSDFKDREAELALLENLARTSGRPLSISLAQADASPDHWRGLLEWIHSANEAGLPLFAQVAGRPVGLMLSFETTLNPFIGTLAYQAVRNLPFDEKIAKLQQPELRQAIIDDIAEGRVSPAAKALSRFDKTFVLGNPPNYEQEPSQSLGAQAERAGVNAAAFTYDRLLENGGRNFLYYPFMNYAEGSLEPSLEMMKDEYTVLGLGDGGAHLGSICDASFTTHMVTHWSRDRERGEKVPLETVVKWHTHDTARSVGLCDRGLIAPGYKADLIAFDYAALTLHEPKLVRDLPAGGGRLMQGADGYRYTIVSGEITYEDGKATGALPGRLVRGATVAPNA
ncbi:MAG: N-acyl-D-aspartate/D-glutamate deacylase [Myxococcota bacterium]|jgi:N-acyl-D-aspartate/D-glutamate deacylase